MLAGYQHQLVHLLLGFHKASYIRLHQFSAVEAKHGLSLALVTHLNPFVYLKTSVADDEKSDHVISSGAPSPALFVICYFPVTAFYGRSVAGYLHDCPLSIHVSDSGSIEMQNHKSCHCGFQMKQSQCHKCRY